MSSSPPIESTVSSKPNPQPTPQRRSVAKWLSIALLCSVFLAVLYQFGLFVMVASLNFYNPNSSAVMRSTKAQLQQHNPQAHISFQWVPYDAISDNLKRAVVAAEDANFFNHGGVEWEAIRQAWDYNRKQASKGTARRRGGSTITQQLAKNLFLSTDRSYWRKGQELILAYMLEALLSKQRILELYLNLAQWGQATFGAQAAAERYYQTPAARLTVQQAARLAAMLPNPSYYDKQGNTNYLRSRTATIGQRSRLIQLP